MKHNVLMLHGYQGDSSNHWFPWLEKELHEHGVVVVAPQFSSDDATKDSWIEVLNEYREHINESTIIIGHSLGSALMLSLLSSLEKPVALAVHVGGFGKAFGEREEDIICSSFVKDVPWKKVRASARQHMVIASSNDPEIPLEISAHLAMSLRAPMRIIENAGHFCADDGYESFPELLDIILNTIYVTYDEFSKMNMRIGQIKNVNVVEGSEKLLSYEVDFGNETRRIVSGIRGYVEDPKSIEGKKVLYITNLAPRMIMGIKSEGMLMAIGDDQMPFSFLISEQEVNAGSTVR